MTIEIITTAMYRRALEMACVTLASREIGGRDCCDDKRPDYFGALEIDYYEHFLRMAAAQKAAKEKE